MTATNMWSNFGGFRCRPCLSLFLWSLPTRVMMVLCFVDGIFLGSPFLCKLTPILQQQLLQCSQRVHASSETGHLKQGKSSVHVGGHKYLCSY